MGKSAGSFSRLQGSCSSHVRQRRVVEKPLPEDHPFLETVGYGDELSENRHAYPRRPPKRSLPQPRRKGKLKLLEWQHQRAGIPHPQACTDGCATAGASPNERSNARTTDAPSLAGVATWAVMNLVRFGSHHTQSAD